MALKKLAETGSFFGNGIRDVQATTFSVDGVARFACNTWEELEDARGTRGFDIVIVGSGMYGAYLAAKLHEFGQALGSAAPRIAVLESGPFLISEHIQNLTRTGDLGSLVFEPLVGPTSQRQIEEPAHYLNAGNLVDHAKCVGGKSLFWGGWTPRLLEDNLRRADSPWPEEVVDYLFQTGVPPEEIDDGYPFVEWEIGASESTDFIQGDLYNTLLTRAKAVASEVTLGNGNGTHLMTPLPPPVAVQGTGPQSGLFGFDKYSSLILLLDAIRRDHQGDDRNRRLFLVPNAHVTSVTMDQGIATGVRVALVDRIASGVPFDRNAPKTIRSIENFEINPGGMVVLAGHAIESTRIALNSFRRPIGVGPELMGRNLMAHVRGNHVWQVKREALSMPTGAPLGNAALHVPGRSRTVTQQGRQGEFHFQFYASANVPPNSGSGPLDAEEYLYRLLPNFDEIQDILQAQNDELIAIGIRTCGEMFGEREKTIPSAELFSWMDTPVPGVSDELFMDGFGNIIERVPRAFVRIVETPSDRAVREDQTTAAFQLIAEMFDVPISETGSRFKTLEEFLASGNKVRYYTDSNVEQDGIGTTYHECGTLWMGTDPYGSVTDVHGRFHHVSNAYACDQSLFPSAGSANPVPTGLALARKIARGITSRFTSSPTVSVTESGFDDLFDGTFSNWRSADAANFLTIPETGQPTILNAGVENQNPLLGVLYFSSEEFDDFELRLQWRTFSPYANGGIFLRAPEPVGNLFLLGGFYDQALEVQIDERGFDVVSDANGSPRHKTGALYGRLPATRSCSRAISPRDGRPGYWNDFVIQVQGQDITVRCNNEIVCEGEIGNALRRGFIGLQCHTEVVQYRSIRIKRI
ncbi:family 16 glycoside hydrolase [Gimesia sp.]|uniref:family 16 glycoside hydrolase n=1 Tax=Gimesia sp. TaxID=2024833 RepID=UPI000C6A26B7|nr:family 16 glycoside hydrolase [Gimesia sp.]MAX39314.1 hypothetical protein [Gimesia sp.]|tara:strand:+ start:23599 stop:26193 length:2595 start_codon:yes stop_codon:yes gene_type:complete